MVYFNDIKRYREDGLQATIPWSYLKTCLNTQDEACGLDLQPDFQRHHVWNDEQQRTKYVEHILKGGRGASRELRFNSFEHSDNYEGDKKVVLVDGLQRLTAVLKFLNDEIPAFGHYYSEYEDNPRDMLVVFDVYVNNLNSLEEVLEWYIDINDGGVAHTPEEIAKVKKQLEQEQHTKNVRDSTVKP